MIGTAGTLTQLSDANIARILGEDAKFLTDAEQDAVNKINGVIVAARNNLEKLATRLGVER